MHTHRELENYYIGKGFPGHGCVAMHTYPGAVRDKSLALGVHCEFTHLTLHPSRDWSCKHTHTHVHIYNIYSIAFFFFIIRGTRVSRIAVTELFLCNLFPSYGYCNRKLRLQE